MDEASARAKDLPHSELVEAAASWYIRFPEGCYRRAEENGAEERPAGVSKHNSDHAIACPPEFVVWEDPEVLEENRELCAGQAQVITVSCC